MIGFFFFLRDYVLELNDFIVFFIMKENVFFIMKENKFIKIEN